MARPLCRRRYARAVDVRFEPADLELLEGYRPEQLEYRTGGPPIAENLYTEPMLRGAFGDLEILELAVYDAVIEEGSAHKGLSALIEARKPA